MTLAAAYNSLVNAYAHPLARRAPFNVAARVVKWQMQSRLSKGPHIIEWIKPARLQVRRGMSGATGNVYFGLHEFTDMAFLLHFLRPDDLFFDVGANVGSYSVLASAVCGAHSWSFEPAPETMADLKANITLNRLEERVRLFDCALGDTDGLVAFTVGQDAKNRVAHAEDRHVQTVPIRRLDDLVDGHFPIMIKIDVEGHEPAMLQGAARTLERTEVQAVEIETVTQEVADQFAKAGFTRHHYDPFQRKLSRTPCQFKASNSLFLRDEAFVAARLSGAVQREALGVLF